MFERLYDAGGDLVALHEDINSAEQSVSYNPPSPVEEIAKPLGKAFDKTGYWLARYWWTLAILAAALLATGAFRYMANDRKSIFNEEDADGEEL